MQRALSTTLLIALSLTGAAFAQSGDSLADAARANRANQQAREANGDPPKVITNQDLPAGSRDVPQEVESNPMTTVSGVQKPNRPANRQFSNQLQDEQRGVQWRMRIQDQENQIALLQRRIDRVNASVQNAVGTAQYDTPPNRYQAVQTERLAMLREMLEQQKQRLATLQDAARHAGVDR